MANQAASRVEEEAFEAEKALLLSKKKELPRFVLYIAFLQQQENQWQKNKLYS